MKLFTIILFAVTYILMIALPKKRPYVALISAVIFVVSADRLEAFGSHFPRNRASCEAD